MNWKSCAWSDEFALGLLGWRIYRAFVIREKSDDQVRATTHCLIIKQQDVEQILLWSDIVRFWQDVTVIQSSWGQERARHHRYTIELKDGTIMVFNDDWGGVAHLGNLLQKVTTAHLLPQAQLALTRGESVKFGHSISVTPEGLKLDVLMPWSEINAVKVSKGYFKIENKRGGKFFRWESIKVSEIPNVGVLVGLVGQFIFLLNVEFRPHQ